MDRRRFLRRSGTLVAAGVAGTACTSAAPYDPRLLAQPALEAVLGSAVVRDIGAQYLESLAPAERTASALRAAIANAASDARPWPWSPTPALELLVADDFAAGIGAGRLVLPGGWVLSVTEARQCALAALATR